MLEFANGNLENENESSTNDSSDINDDSSDNQTSTEHETGRLSLRALEKY